MPKIKKAEPLPPRSAVVMPPTSPPIILKEKTHLSPGKRIKGSVTAISTPLLEPLPPALFFLFRRIEVREKPDGPSWAYLFQEMTRTIARASRRME